NFFRRKVVSADVETVDLRISCGQQLELYLPRNFKLSLQALLLDQLVVEHYLFDNDRHLRGQQHQHFEIVFVVRVELVAFEIEYANHFLVRDNGRDHLRSRARARVYITRLLAHVRRGERLAAYRHVTDQALAHFQVQLLHIGDVITTHGLGMKNAGVFFAHLPIRRPDVFDQIDSRRVIGNQRVQRVHHEIHDFLEIERAADCLRDVEQHPQLVNYGQAGGGTLRGWSHTKQARLKGQSQPINYTC